MNNTFLVSLCVRVFALAGACGSDKPDAEGAGAARRAAARADTRAARHHRRNRHVPRSPPTPTSCIRAARRAASPPQYFVELVNQQRLGSAFAKPQRRHAGLGKHRLRAGGDRTTSLGAEGYSLDVSRRRRHHHRAHAGGALLRRGHAVAAHHREADAGPVHRSCRRSGSSTRRASRGAASCSIPRATTSRRSTSSSSSTGWRCTSSTCCTGISPTTRPGASRSRSIRSSRRSARGACRPAPAARADIDPATGKPRLYGGFYTQDQVRDIVAHAADAPHHRGAGNRDAGPRDRRGGRLSRARRDQQAAEGRAGGMGHLPDAVQRRRLHVHVPRRRARRSHRAVPERVHPRRRRRGGEG